VDPIFGSAVLLLLLFVFLAAGVWIAIALIAVSAIGMMVFTDAPAGLVMATTIWANSSTWTLTALPLFIWMGEILFRTRISEDLFRGLAPWMNWLPGRLLHTNVFGCAMFATVSGSSTATCATVGRMTLPELGMRRYPESLSVGSLSGASTLGLMIPPSITMIVYGLTAQVSISKLFIAGILPGIALMLLFGGYIVIWSLANRKEMPAADPRVPLRQRIAASRRLLPIIGLMIGVIGSIYAGIATATEAAILGVVGSLLIAAASGGLTRETFWESAMSAMRTSTMIAFILAGSSFMSVMVGFLGIPRMITEAIGGLGLSPPMLLVLLTLFFVLLGCVLDGISIIVLTSAILLPLVSSAGFDLIWFGIYLVLVIEMSMITPPVGFNLFVLKAMTNRSIGFIAGASAPFFALMLLLVALLYIWPGMATTLPRYMMGG
jgi:C4-dicarboxylate transporter DctM subunit